MYLIELFNIITKPYLRCLRITRKDWETMNRFTSEDMLH